MLGVYFFYLYYVKLILQKIISTHRVDYCRRDELIPHSLVVLPYTLRVSLPHSHSGGGSSFETNLLLSQYCNSNE